jgi:hypothetical protein
MIKMYEDVRKEGHQGRDSAADFVETSENKHNAMRAVMRRKIRVIRLSNKGSRYLAFTILFSYHEAELEKDKTSTNFTNEVFIMDVLVENIDTISEWRKCAVKSS